MKKKILQFGLLLSILSFSVSVFAQENVEKPKVQDYPRVGFWSNWSIGADLGLHIQMNQQNGSIYRSLGLGAHGFFQKKFHPLWNVRLYLGVPRITKDNNGPADRYAAAGADMMWSLMNAISYDPERKVDLFIMAGNGISFLLGGTAENGKWSLYSRGGMEFDWYVSKHSTIFIDGLVGVYDVVNPKGWFKGDPRTGALNAYVGLGYMYNFGLTKADQELFAQKEKANNCDALNDQINDLASELASCKQNERRLEDRVNDLENELAMCKKNNNEAANKELQDRINQMKNDQLKFYALPFSINYATNQSEVPAGEQVKVKTIAKVLESDKDLKLKIVGFCDATGSDEINQKLSEKRAENVKKMLVNKYGIAEDRLTCEGKGKTIVFGDGACAIDRRVSFYREIE